MHGSGRKPTLVATPTQLRLTPCLHHTNPDPYHVASRRPCLPISRCTQFTIIVSYSLTNSHSVPRAPRVHGSCHHHLLSTYDQQQSNSYDIVISLDCFKTLDIVRHSTLLSKMAELDMPMLAYVYNCLVYSVLLCTCTPHLLNGGMSSTKTISVSRVHCRDQVSDQHRTSSQPPISDRIMLATVSSSLPTTPT